MFKGTGIFQAVLNAARRRWHDPQIVAGVGGFVCLLGATYLAGWALRISALIHGQPGLDTIPPSGALGFLLLGAGLAVAVMGGGRWGVLCGGCAALLGGATLLGYLFGVSSGVDSLLFQLLQVKSLSAPGGMPPGGGTAFLVAGVGIVCAALQRWTAQSLARRLSPWSLKVVRLIGATWTLAQNSCCGSPEDLIPPEAAVHPAKSV